MAIVNRHKAPGRRYLSSVTNGNTASARGSPSDARSPSGGLSQSDQSVPIGLINWIKVVGWIGVLLLLLGLWGAIVSVLVSAILWEFVG